MSAARSKARRATERLMPTERTGDPPLSFAQQRLWFLDQLGTAAAYNMPWAFRLDGPIDVAVLQHTLDEIVRRHEALRTCFPAVDGRPVQHILPSLSVPVRVVEVVSEDEARAVYQEEALAPFDLAEGPLLRATVIHFGPDEHLLFLSIHHIVFDGWSIGVMNRELFTLYRAFAAGEPSPLPPLPIQYADFSSWQNGWLQDELLDAQLSYLREKLAGLAPLALPTDHPRPRVQTYRGRTVRLAYAPELTRGLRTLSQRQGVTLAMTLLAAYKTLLARWSGQADIAVGAPIANRTRSEVENLIGFFVNSLVLRTDLAGDPSFAEVLGRVRSTALEAYEHQDLPFERLVDELRTQRDQSRNPIFQVVFAFQNAPHEALQLPGLKVRRYDGGTVATRFDLELHLQESPDGAIRGGICYNTALFEESTIERLADRFQRLLEAIVQDVDAPISHANLLPEAERRQILDTWNDTSISFATTDTLHQRFERQVRRTPDRIALTFENEQLTYAELNRRSNQLAHRLRDLGVGPDDLVGLALDRGSNLVIGILGILKAGGGYLPLDLANPRDRIAFILDDTQVRIVVTEQSQLEKLPEHDATVVCLDRDQEAIAGEPDTDLSSVAGPEHVAYVIYTSGSTGTPKGVLVEHGTVARLFDATDAWYGFDEDDVWTLFHSSAFDFSVWEVWGALLYGGRLVVVPYWVSRSPEDFLKLLDQERVTVLNQTPSAFRQLIHADERPGGARDLALRYIIFGGEALDLQSLRPWFDRHGDQRPQLVNMYGITETTVHVTYRPLSRRDLAEAPGSVIGRPIPDLQVYILDERLEPVPIGSPGELFVGGAGIARGYLNRPELTAQRFVRDPFRPEPDARLYRTGDVGRFLPNGDIEYLGRNDEQVKIRGYRIELGEIEAAIDAHPWIRESVVDLRPQRDGGRRLIGYVVPDPEGAQALQGTIVEQWQARYDSTYGRPAEEEDPTFNIVGWVSSYTEEPIPAAEMREWVEETVDRLRRGAPQRVLDIGCGTGLLLFRVAPHCTSYVASDFSPVALDYVGRHLERVDGLSSKVTLWHRAADDFEDLEPESFDLVVLNSVIQYFPGVDYLLEVIEGAVAHTAPGGRVYIGDVRDLRLLEAYHASVQLHQADDDLDLDELRGRVRRLIAQEEELVVDPAFFLALARHLPRISGVRIEPKRSAARNELTKFRYEVTLEIDSSAPEADVPWLGWSADDLSLETLRERLLHGPPQGFGVRGIPDARTVADIAAATRLLHDSGGSNAGALRAELEAMDAGAGVDPADLVALETGTPYRVEISRDLLSERGTFDVTFTARDRVETATPFETPRVELLPWARYANHPLQAQMTRKLTPELRASLERTLPEYMAPSAFVVLPSMPLTENGKIDRKALPEPEWFLSHRRGAYTPPRTETEILLASIWAELLGVEQIGVDDNFFDLGGDSLLAMQLANRLEERMGGVVHPSIVFDAPTLEGMARYLDEHYDHSASGRSAPLTEEDVDHLRSSIPPPRPARIPAERGPGPIFVLSAERTGSTLLRIMLAGHPDLFAPPELKLLPFNTLRERREKTSGRGSFMLEGTIRTLKELDRSTTEEAVRAMETFEERDLSTCDFYRILQERIAPRTLVDKTASYGQDLAVLRRAETWFDEPRYIRLLRHPCAMIASFEDARLDLVQPFDHPFSPRELAELLWYLSYLNIETFLTDVPRERVHDVRFEELVRDPEGVMTSVCAFLDLPFHPLVANPYVEPERRMVDGLHEVSRPIGDPKFLTHRRIDPAIADRWREPGRNLDPHHLGAMTRALAADWRYGFEADSRPSAPAETTAVALLSDLHSRGVRISADGDTLRVNAPHGALDDNLKAALRRHKPELLELLTAARSEGRPHPPRVSSGSAAPLSFAQDRLWFLDQLSPDTATFNVHQSLRLRGALDVNALRRAVNGIIARHESVRTVFPAVNGLPHQRIMETLVLPLTVERAEGDPLSAASRLIKEESQRPFDLARGPLIRARLIELGDDDHLLMLTLHHIVTDAWSMGVLSRELSALYEAFIDGHSSPLRELPVQYAACAHWQRENLQGERLERALAFWRRRLGDDPPPLDLLTDRPRPAVQTYRGRTVELELTGPELDAVRDLGRSAGATGFMTLLAAFKALLMRHTGQDDICVGIPIAGRDEPEVEGLIGCFLNTLVLRTDLSGQPTFRELLDRVRRVAVEAYDHQEIPFEKLLAELQPRRDRSRTPLFQVFCNMVDAPTTDFDFGGLRVEPMRVPHESAKFDLSLYLLETPRRLRVQLNYNTDLFDESTIRVMLEHYRALLSAVTTDPDRPLAALSLVDGATVPPRFGADRVPAPRGAHRVLTGEHTAQTIPARFAEQVVRGPDRPAVVTPSAQWTYAELAAHAQCAAAAVRRAHGSGDGRIALLFDTGAPMLAGLLGSLWAGFAYVPLDPAYPVKRLRFMLEDTQARVIVTDGRRRALAEQLATGGCVVVDLDALPAQDDEPPPPIPTDPDALAYVLYTSGSTGQPKGVVQSHRNVLGHIRAYTNALRIAESDRLTLMSSYTFDAAVMDIYGALLNGATLVPGVLHEEPLAEIMSHLRDARITIFHSTPSVFRLFLTEFESEDIPWPTARLVVLGGEETRPRDVALYQRRFGPDCLLVNGLGPSESTLALQHFMDHRHPARSARVPVGHPVEGTEVVLLDEIGNATEVYGEIAIIGQHVALGYWNRPDATAAAFETLADGRRRYRTGDVGRRRADGAIEFIGRCDTQVKVHGHRIEPGEIESVLTDHRAVRATAVVALGTPAELIAYVVPEGEARPEIPALHRHVQEYLPAFMVPSTFVWIDAVPLTPNGKLDHAALPAPAPPEPSAAGHAPPETETEQVVAGIWTEVLDRASVGVNDSWFDLGGHSLLALRLVSRMSDSFGVSLPVTAVFEAPTVRRLAAVVEQRIVEEVESLPEEALARMVKTTGLGSW